MAGCSKCSSFARCATHAAEYAVKAMADRGFVPLAAIRPPTCTWSKDALERKKPEVQQGRPRENDGGEYLENVLKAAGIEFQFWAYEARPVPRSDGTKEDRLHETWYVPKTVAFVVCMAIGRVPWPSMIPLLRLAKEDPEFPAAVEAAYRLGGDKAACDVIDGHAPGILVR